MTKTIQNLTESNRDYAVFLPSISGFYNAFISKQQHEEYVPKDRIPVEFENGIEGMNFLNADKGYFKYKWALYSAGHAQLDIAKSDISESMVQKRDRNNTLILGDSGGFQIAKGVIKFDWEKFYEGSADTVRTKILNWLEHTADYSMILDIPTWAARPPLSARTGLRSFQDCLDGTLYNNAFFMKHRKNQTKFLNVLQGSDTEEADIWYEQVKDLPFEGWAMGGNNMQDFKLILRRLINLRDEKLLEKGERDLMHFLGSSKLEFGVALTALQREIRRTVNEDFTITYDCASPFIATAHGQMYTQHVHRNDRTSYIMDKMVDDKRLSGSKIPLPWNSPIAERMTMGDVCWYKPGDLNKLGKEGKSSWDSFSYFLQMGHNVYQHIESVQRANALTDAACVLHQPPITQWSKVKKGQDEFDTWVPRNVIYFVELAKEIFSSETPMDVMEKANGFLSEFSKGRLRKSSATTFTNLFDTEDAGADNEAGAFEEHDDKLDELEQTV